VSETLDEILRHAQDLGFFGPGPIEVQRRHAEAFCRLALGESAPVPGWEFLDLGAGGGLPGLVLATMLPADVGWAGTLLDSQRRRTAFLADAVRRLGLGDRLEPVHARAEDAAREPERRERYALVVARGFGPPPVTAECAVGFLRPDGQLAVSEPPEPDPARWPDAGLAALGLSAPELDAGAGVHIARFRRRGPLDPRWPRKPGTPQKRPLW
jgi:16S rRNA (guanine527-N7)-methyltransferase